MKLIENKTQAAFINFDVIGRIYISDKELTKSKDGFNYKYFDERKVKIPWYSGGGYITYQAGYYHENDVYWKLKNYNKHEHIEEEYLYDCPSISIFDKSNTKIGQWFFNTIYELNDKLKECEPYFINNGISMNLEFIDDEKFILDENTECLS